jgi:cystathionine beta-lyase/cystathionine gamma-synthase
MDSDDVADRSRTDLVDDMDELMVLAAGMRIRLDCALVERRRSRDHYLSRTLRTELAQLDSAADVFRSYWDELQDLMATAGRLPLETLIRKKAAYADLIRSQYSVGASLVVASDWQSPAFACAGATSAGRVTNRVAEHRDDYKRDRHPEARTWERAFLREYVDSPARSSLSALMTASGMAAFTTLLAYLCNEVRPTGPILAGRGMYHECRELLAKSQLGREAIWVDEPELVSASAQLKPAVVFVDAPCNSRGIALPRVDELIATLGRARGLTYLVLDRSCGSTFVQPYARAADRSLVRILMFESITKYAQFGIDRTAAGVIVAPSDDGEALDAWREHLGTNIADVCAVGVPLPDRALLERRLRRIERNALLLARHLDSIGDGRVIAGACYPGLPRHPCFVAAHALGFAGGFLGVTFTPGFDRSGSHQRFVELVLDCARRQGVALAAGAGFGFNTTRVYRTAVDVGAGPFVRIASGTESLHEIGVLKEVLAEAVTEFSRAEYASAFVRGSVRNPQGIANKTPAPS